MIDILNKADFENLIDNLIKLGYNDEIEWSRTISPCLNAITFANEATWVILNSGMKNQIAKIIWDRIITAWSEDIETSSAFGHKGKVAAIDYIFLNRNELFEKYQLEDNKVEFLKSLPWIGGITCWHLAKNLGLDVVKPDRWLVRVANYYKTSPDDLCRQISETTGETKHTVDLIIWRCCNLGLINI